MRGQLKIAVAYPLDDTMDIHYQNNRRRVSPPNLTNISRETPKSDPPETPLFGPPPKNPETPPKKCTNKNLNIAVPGLISLR